MAYRKSSVRRIGDFLDVLDLVSFMVCEVKAHIRRIFLDGYGVLVVRTENLSRLFLSILQSSIFPFSDKLPPMMMISGAFSLLDASLFLAVFECSPLLFPCFNSLIRCNSCLNLTASSICFQVDAFIRAMAIVHVELAKLVFVSVLYGDRHRRWVNGSVSLHKQGWDRFPAVCSISRIPFPFDFSLPFTGACDIALNKPSLVKTFFSLSPSLVKTMVPAELLRRGELDFTKPFFWGAFCLFAHFGDEFFRDIVVFGPTDGTNLLLQNCGIGDIDALPQEGDLTIGLRILCSVWLSHGCPLVGKWYVIVDRSLSMRTRSIAGLDIWSGCSPYGYGLGLALDLSWSLRINRPEPFVGRLVWTQGPGDYYTSSMYNMCCVKQINRTSCGDLSPYESKAMNGVDMFYDAFFVVQ
nr:hypothetical protein [Tanacetum cinerariifolium]